MTLEDFEKSLAKDKENDENIKKGRHDPDEKRRHHRHHRHHHHQHGEDEEDHHRQKRRKHSRDRRDRNDISPRSDRRHPRERSSEPGSTIEESRNADKGPSSDLHPSNPNGHLQRDSWMEQPSALDIKYTQKNVQKPPQVINPGRSKADFELKIHENELNKHHLEDLAEGKDVPEEFAEQCPKHEVDYHFGDAGAQWRMTKLKGVYRRAEETGKAIDAVGEEQYGDLQSFDDAREEQTELDRRETYGEGYVGKEKPSGELFQERKVEMDLRRERSISRDETSFSQAPPKEMKTGESVATTVPIDQTALNRLKAQMLKAQVRGSPNATELEVEYNSAIAGFANQKQPDVVVLGAMDNRQLAGSRKGEVVNVDNKRGRERGLVEENEDMSIEDMVKQERRTRQQTGGDGQLFAESIAKDAKFDNDLDYLDENANKLAKRVQKSEINLKNTAVSEVQKMNRILDNCPLCHHEDTDTPPIAPVVSLATRVYLTLPTEPEISEGGACIIPVQHRGNLLECDDDEWEEIRVCAQMFSNPFCNR